MFAACNMNTAREMSQTCFEIILHSALTIIQYASSAAEFLTFYSVGEKSEPQTHDHNSVNS